MTVANLASELEVPRRGLDDASFALYRFDDESGRFAAALGQRAFERIHVAVRD